MSVLVIDGGDVAALYCDTDDEAFGPTFRSAAHAEDFLRYLRDEHANRDPFLADGWFHSADPRRYTRADLRNHYRLWLSERCGDDGELLPVEAGVP